MMPARPSRPENMGFIGVCSTSQLLGLPIALPEVDSGGVDGKYGLSLNSVSSMMAGLWWTSEGEPIEGMTEGPLLRRVGGCEQDEEPGRE